MIGDHQGKNYHVSNHTLNRMVWPHYSSYLQNRDLPLNLVQAWWSTNALFPNEFNSNLEGVMILVSNRVIEEKTTNKGVYLIKFQMILPLGQSLSEQRVSLCQIHLRLAFEAWHKDRTWCVVFHDNYYGVGLNDDDVVHTLELRRQRKPAAEEDMDSGMLVKKNHIPDPSVKERCHPVEKILVMEMKSVFY